MLPTETLLEILVNVRRRDLDALELINRAVGSLVAAKFSDAPRRIISLMFDEEGIVMLFCPSDGWRRVPMVKLARYLPRSIVTKMVFKWMHTITKDTYETLPCFATCSNLQLAHFIDVFSNVNGALEWILGTHAATAGAKHLSITETWSYYLIPFVVAIEQQFVNATTPASFDVDLNCFFVHHPTLYIGTTRELENVDTKEHLKIDVDTEVRQPNGEPTFKTKVTIRRKPTA